MDERLLHVNRYGVLQPTGLFWLGCLILARFLLFSFFALIASRRSVGAMHAFDGGVPWLGMAVEVPVLLLLLAAGRRQPDAGRVFRLLWRHAKWLVLVTVLGHLAWAGFFFADFNGFIDKADLVVFCFALLDVSLLCSFWFSGYYKQLFSEFPEQKSL
jgi:hypothetical protein